MKKLLFVLLMVISFGCTEKEPVFSLVGKTYYARVEGETIYINYNFVSENKVNITFHSNSPLSVSNSASNNTRTYTLDYPNITISGGIIGKFISPTELMLSTNSNHYILL